MPKYPEILSYSKVESYADLAEDRLKRIKPTERNHYKDKTRRFFYRYPLLVPGSELLQTDKIRIFSPLKYQDDIADLVIPQFERIENLSGIYPSNVMIFAGPGEVMANHYRSIGTSVPPYEFAINGADTCFINTDWIDLLGIGHPAVVRSITHEPNHAAWNFILSDEPHYGFVTDLDTTVHEALGGPLDPEAWDDVTVGMSDIPEMDFSQLLENGNLFWKLISQYQQQFGFNEPYFMNPVVAAFYKWASSVGDIEYWYNEGLILKPQVKEKWMQEFREKHINSMATQSIQ